MKNSGIRGMALIAAAALVMAACGGTSALTGEETTVATPPPTTQAPPPTTQAPPPPTTQPPPPTTLPTPPPTTAAPTTTTTTSSTTTTTMQSTVYVFAGGTGPQPGSDGADGSGCVAGDTEALPPGVWFAFAVSLSATEVQLDLACWYSGAEADAVAAARGDPSPTPNGFYIVNDNPLLRTMPAAGAIGYPMLSNGSLGGPVSMAAFAANPGPSNLTVSPYPVWLFVNYGQITEISIQYIP